MVSKTQVLFWMLKIEHFRVSVASTVVGTDSITLTLSTCTKMKQFPIAAEEAVINDWRERRPQQYILTTDQGRLI